MYVERRRGAQGFTLLEVLVALAIAGLAIIGLFQAGSGGMFAVDTAARAEEALQRAQSHLAAVGRDAALVEGEFTDDDGGGYQWRLRVRQASSRQLLPGGVGNSTASLTLFDVEVAILWPGRDGERSVVLKTLRLGTSVGGE
jgi:general secretion pathway protein I